MKLFDMLKLRFLAFANFGLSMIGKDVKGFAKIDDIIFVGIGAVLASVCIPIGINAIIQADNTSWGTIHTIWSVVLPLVIIVAAVLYFLPRRIR